MTDSLAVYRWMFAFLLGFVIGLGFSERKEFIDFDGEYDRAKYEWKLNKEKRHETP